MSDSVSVSGEEERSDYNDYLPQLVYNPPGNGAADDDFDSIIKGTEPATTMKDERVPTDDFSSAHISVSAYIPRTVQITQLILSKIKFMKGISKDYQVSADKESTNDDQKQYNDSKNYAGKDERNSENLGGKEDKKATPAKKRSKARRTKPEEAKEGVKPRTTSRKPKQEEVNKVTKQQEPRKEKKKTRKSKTNENTKPTRVSKTKRE